MSDIKIKHLSLTNFRNIEHAEYDLTDACCFVGKNYIGKTNSILAIYWLLTGKMLDGSSNDESLKRKDATRETVVVEAVFDKDGQQKTIRKEYAEKWTKTQGTNDLRLSGHITTYTIDGIVQKTNSGAIREINDFLELSDDKYFRISKLDIQQALMNPMYVAEILDWQVLRQLIVGIIGDVGDKDVFTRDPRTLPAKELLVRYNGDQNKALKLINQEIAGAGKSIEEKEIIIKELSNNSDVSVSELQTAHKQLAIIQESIDDIKRGMNVENPVIEMKRKEIDRIESEIKEMRAKEFEAFNNSCLIINTQIREANNFQKNRYESLQTKGKERDSIQKSIDTKNIELKRCELHIESITDDRAKAIERYREIQKRIFAYESIECPNCHYQLNKDAEDAAREKFELQKKNDLDEINLKGKRLSLDLQNEQSKKKEIESEIQQLNEAFNEATSQLNKLSDSYQVAYEQYMAISDKKTEFIESEQLIGKREELKQLQSDLYDFKNETKDPTGFNQIRKLEESKRQYEEVISKHYAYEQLEKAKNERIAELKVLSKRKVDYELIKESLNLFIKAKLSILTEKMRMHFGDVCFCLMKENIKEGSWDEVCYPLICSKKAPFKDGSTSEKIITGIKIIEALKNALQINGLPILIDECGQLDNDSLKRIKEITTSQIVATKVDDNYERPQLMAL